MIFERQELRHVATLNDEVLPESFNRNQEICYAEVSDVSQGQPVKWKDPIAFADAPSRARRVVRDGDTVISTVRTYLKAITYVDNPPNPAIVSTGFAVVHPRSIHPKYLAYATQAHDFVDQIVSKSVGVSYPAISPPDVAHSKIHVPPASMQARIADYLDHETAEIDRFIKDLSELRDGLHERFNSERDRVVAGSSNARAAQARHVLLGLRDGTHGTHARVTSEGVPLLSAKNISSGELIISDNESYISEDEAFELTKAGFPSYGDVLLIVVGATIGRSAAYALPQSLPFQRSVAFLRPNREIITSDFLLHSVRSRFFQDQLSLRSKTAAQPGVYLGDVGSCEIRVPDMKYQIDASYELDKLQKITEDTSGNIATSIALARERRAALITAAVTGQIDVTARNKPAAEQLEDDIAQGLHREN